MDWLTLEDWQDLQSIAYMLGGFAVLLLALALLKRMFATPGHWLNRISGADFGFIILFTCVMTLMDILERHGISGFLIVPLAAILALPSIWYANRKRTAAQVTAIANPNATQSIPVVPQSREEARANHKRLLAAIAFVLVTLAPIFWLAFSGVKLGATGGWWVMVYCVGILALIGFGAAGRWPGAITLQSVIEINATQQQVWDVLKHAQGGVDCRGIVSRTERLDEPGEVYRLHYFNLDRCVECGLPKDPDSPGMTNRVEVLEARYPALYRTRAYPKGANGVQDSMMAYEEERYEIAALPDGRSRVTNTNTVVRPKVWLVALLKTGDPLGEHLRTVKAHLDGVAVDTVWTTGAATIAAQRSAPKFCGCAASTPAHIVRA